MIRTAALSMLLLLCLAGRAAASALPEGVDRSLKAGLPWISVTLDPDGESARIHAAIDIPASPDRVWQTMTDCKDTRRMIKSLVECRVVRTGEGWDVREHITKGGPLWPSFRYVFRSDYDTLRSIRFRKLDGNLKTFEGEWALSSGAGGKSTRVTYQSRVSAAVFAPPMLIRAGLRRDTPKVLEIMRRLATGG